MAPMLINAALLVPTKKLGTVSLNPLSELLSNPTTTPVTTSGVKLTGARPPVTSVATIRADSTTAMITVITGQNEGRVLKTSSLVGSFLLRLLMVAAMVLLSLPRRPLLP